MARRDTNGHANGSGGGASARSVPNASFARTAFLDGGNAAYIEQLQDRYLKDPASLDASWREFFAQLEDDGAAVAKAAQGPRWKRPGWPAAGTDDLVSALDGNWAAVETRIGGKLKTQTGEAGSFSQEDLLRATRDSVHALMMIRAYRMRGHLHANLDPLGLEAPKDREELHPATYGFSEADYSRKIFIDGVLGLQYATVPEMIKILQRTYCGTIGFEFMHISDPAEKSWLQQRIEGPGKEITFTKEGKRAILTKLVEFGGIREISRRQIYWHQAFRPRWGRGHGRGARTDHQARRRLGGPGHRPRHGAPGPPQYPVPGHGETAPGDFQ